MYVHRGCEEVEKEKKVDNHDMAEDQYMFFRRCVDGQRKMEEVREGDKINLRKIIFIHLLENLIC